MATAKTATLSFRIEPGVKEALRSAAEQEHRSIANMVEVMIREYCRRSGVTIAEQHQPASAGQDAKTNQKKSPRSKKSK
ncbi:hypothetical protein J2794_004491 [Paraburkholderia terricola]|uniref:hypothetical protein n=1 Tax=Paraburkholderia terricola TaxID=169427 RepID=UPI002861E766|nr:hypothetical protein [Paraburkholderia terricola]MDR6448361.1 hypothetical protein [Paraburkholderia terricola]